MLDSATDTPTPSSTHSVSIPPVGKNFVEFFAGIGLVRLGLEQAGWKCVYANDIDSKKEEVYSRNFGDNHFCLQDIWGVDARTIPHSPLFTASFPCVDLSVAGHRKGIKGEESGTYWAFIKILKNLKRLRRMPKIVMLENVVGFLTSNDGKDVQHAINSLNDLGYMTDIFLLDAKHFTPQSRPRVFVVGFEETLASVFMSRCQPEELMGNWDREIQSSDSDLRPKKILKVIQSNPKLNWGLLDLPKLPKRNITLNSIIEDLPDDHERWWDTSKMGKLIKQMKNDHLKILESHKDSEDYLYGTIYRRVRNGGTRAELRTDGLAGCLRTPRGGSSKQIVARSGKGKISARWMTPREYARLQGVPEDFHLPVNDVQSYFGLGDAVCVPAIKWIGENILEPAFRVVSSGSLSD